MRILLRADYPNGPFGDPALLLWEVGESDALLLDIGDLSRFTTRQLLRVRHVFVSHCHIDHFYGFDHFLRVHMGREKTVTFFGPTGISRHVEGKLAGYTWNLVSNLELEFRVVELDTQECEKRHSRFPAARQFACAERWSEPWDPRTPVLDTGKYKVSASALEHGTVSLAYRVEEKVTVILRRERLEELGLRAGPWIEEAKRFALFGEQNRAGTELPLIAGGSVRRPIGEVAWQVLDARQRHRIAYVTDGAATRVNRDRLLPLLEGADLLFAETCFLRKDQRFADATHHFTADFIGELAQDAGVQRLAPFHFSKRYLGRREAVYNELHNHFTGELMQLEARDRLLHL